MACKSFLDRNRPYILQQQMHGEPHELLRPHCKKKLAQVGISPVFLRDGPARPCAHNKFAGRMNTSPRQNNIHCEGNSLEIPLEVRNCVRRCSHTVTQHIRYLIIIYVYEILERACLRNASARVGNKKWGLRGKPSNYR